MTDEECLSKFLEFLEERVELSTGFVTDEKTGNLTHQVVHITCGDYVSVSQPEPLEVILRPAGGTEIEGAVIN